MDTIFKEFIKGTRYPDYATVDLVLRKPEPPHELPAKKGQTVIKLPSPKRFKVRTCLSGPLSRTGNPWGSSTVPRWI